MRNIAIAGILSFAAAPCFAQTIPNGYVGCLTERSLSEFISAAVDENNRQMQALLGTVCFPIGGLEYAVVDRGFTVSEIRVFLGGDSALLFTVAEAAR